MSDGGLAGLLARAAGKVRLLEAGAGGVSTIRPPEPETTRHGAYLLLRSLSVPQLWSSLAHALGAGTPLVLLPGASPLEEEILLRQLPSAPPRGACLALFTSGTSGVPKAVLHAEETLLASARQLARAVPGNGTTCSLLAPWGMAGLVFHVLLPALRGGHVLFGGTPFLDWAALAPDLLAAEGVELLTLNPALLELFLLSRPGGRWRGTLISLTAPLKPALRERAARECAATLREIYGLTEAAGPVLLDGESLGAELRLTGEGELALRGEQLFLGYGSEGRFAPREGWFSTGDRFERAGERWRHEARLRECIDVGGRKLAPRLIEEAMERMPELAECLAFAARIADEERPALLYVRRRDCALPEDELARRVQAWLERELSPELRPRWWREAAALPRGKNGKPDRKAAGLLVKANR